MCTEYVHGKWLMAAAAFRGSIDLQLELAALPARGAAGAWSGAGSVGRVLLAGYCPWLLVQSELQARTWIARLGLLLGRWARPSAGSASTTLAQTPTPRPPRSFPFSLSQSQPDPPSETARGARPDPTPARDRSATRGRGSLLLLLLLTCAPVAIAGAPWRASVAEACAACPLPGRSAFQIACPL